MWGGRRGKTGVASLLALLLAACATGDGGAGVDKIGRHYTAGGFRWAEGATVHVYAGLKDVDGRAAVCGAWSVEDDVTAVSQAHVDVLNAGRVVLDGRTLIRGLGFMNRLPMKQGSRAGEPTTCRLTRTQWEPRMERQRLQIDFPQLRYGL